MQNRIRTPLAVARTDRSHNANNSPESNSPCETSKTTYAPFSISVSLQALFLQMNTKLSQPWNILGYSFPKNFGIYISIRMGYHIPKTPDLMPRNLSMHGNKSL